MSRKELLRFYADEIEALEVQIARAQMEPKSYDLRSGSRAVVPHRKSVETLKSDFLTRIRKRVDEKIKGKFDQVHQVLSEEEQDEATCRDSRKRSSRTEPENRENQRRGKNSAVDRNDRSQENSRNISIGLFEDIDPEDLDEEEVIWSDQHTRHTLYGDGSKRRPEPGVAGLQRKEEILRKTRERDTRHSSPVGLAVWIEEAMSVPQREKEETIANRKSLDTPAGRNWPPPAHYGAEGSRKETGDGHVTSWSKSNNAACSPKRMYVKPPKFDGKGCVESHLLQFNIAAHRNCWNEEEKVDFLKFSLTGDASSILKDVKENVTYEELANKLKQCYGSLEQKEVFKIQLKARKRKKGETLAELMRDIRRLFIQAYPGQNDVISTSIAKDAFIDALDDKELTIRVMEREPQTLDEAYKIAERMELYSKRVNMQDSEE